MGKAASKVEVEAQGDSIQIKVLILPAPTLSPVKNPYIGLINSVAEEINHMVQFHSLPVQGADCQLYMIKNGVSSLMPRESQMETYRNALTADDVVLQLVHNPAPAALNVNLH
ncbi:hypothetical protein ElyMa_006944600 [Elysia marginata]|uniref:Ubiquitin-like domain-containing protein n=1 Tax=Elysia marginata TaxID=1093978 RepID=A0AAV4JIH3_9GAST|nr:hypothetical protein ElyMa_006944600 [Elysia marginata]